MIHEVETAIETWKQLYEVAKLLYYLSPGGGFPEPTEKTASRMREAGIPTNASGGYVRGAGSGTSDSILARLSNGEFVMNAASVRRLGVGFLNGLNRFAEGGLIDLPSPRFAEGGLVSAAAAATPVHLHLGGHVFSTSATQTVAAALVSEAHRQSMTSAGVKPSWFGGRSGGH
jgi:hypothetical protein